MASPETQPTPKARRTAPKKAGAGLSAATGKSATATRNSRAKKTDGQSPVSQRVVSPEERYRMTEVAAYFIAEHDNFDGNPIEYWQAAESQISRMLEQR
jgi:hypothetical protein